LQKLACCRGLFSKKTRIDENYLHFSETAKFLPQEFTLMFNPGRMLQGPSKQPTKGDKDLSVEHAVALMSEVDSPQCELPDRSPMREQRQAQVSRIQEQDNESDEE
jgi:hypothetical protein